MKFLEKFILLELEGNDDRHLSDETFACLSAHLFAKSHVNTADASAALEVAQRLIRDSVAHGKVDISKGVSSCGSCSSQQVYRLVIDMVAVTQVQTGE